MTDSHIAKVSSSFAALSLLSCMLVAFTVGHIARVILVDNPLRARLLGHREASSEMGERTLTLPTPVLPTGKHLPHTTYTSKTFDTSRSSITSRWVVAMEGEKHCVSIHGNECPFADESQKPSTNESAVTEIEDDEDAIHMPSGHHLLVDIENVDAAFLNSEERLVGAMLTLVNECGFTMLSYHCHELEPYGVSCAGVLLESHISFHTWPSAGVITLDLFTCGDKPLLPVVPLVEKLFSIPRSGLTDKPQIVWAHKYRGFNELDEEEKADLTDFLRFPIGIMADFKKQVWSDYTDFQRFDVVDVLRANAQDMESYKRSLLEDGSYESRHPKFFEPDRIVYLDGVMQSRRSGDAAYHEALVHPGMFVHENPRRVAIIGGGEGATLREVLKHKTVENVVMIEIDEKMVKLSREHLSEWSDCSMLDGSAESCFDDPRVSIHYENAFAWFIDRFSEEQKVVEPFDVIIMDALDPQVQKAFVDALYDGGPFLASIPAALADSGLFIAQVGQVAELNDPPENVGLHRNRVNFIRSLTDLGFQVVRGYDEARGGFGASWAFIVASKTQNTMARWVSDSSMLEYLIRKRIKATKDGDSPLQYFDGATMKTFAFPVKADEVVFCRRFGDESNCKSGHGYDHERENIPISALVSKPINGLANQTTGVFTTRDIPIMSYIGLEDAVHRVYIQSSTSGLLRTMNEKTLVSNGLSRRATLGKVVDFIENFGWQQRKSNQAVLTAETTLHAFINEGCKSAANVGQIVTDEEESHVYNPMRDRQVHLLHGSYSSKYIRAGDELLLPPVHSC